MVGARRRGFTLIEALVALTISSALVVMVSTVFLVQNRYYAVQLARSTVQDNARAMTDIVASEVRSVMRGGVVTARQDSLVVRAPIALAAVCADPGGGYVSVQFTGGPGALDTKEVSGFAVRDTLSDSWSYYDIGAWTDIDQSGYSPADECAANGADTVGAYGDFHRLQRLGLYSGSVPVIGQILMLYRKVGYSIGPSLMKSGELALYRTIAGAAPLEYATGIDSTAQFQYRTTGVSTYAPTVTGAALSSINAIRVVAEARAAPEAGATADVRYGWAVNIMLRNGS